MKSIRFHAVLTLTKQGIQDEVRTTNMNQLSEGLDYTGDHDSLHKLNSGFYNSLQEMHI